MDDITIISYPGSANSSLLSLADSRSKYMMPFGGKFRIVDFTIGNSMESGARRTIIYNNIEDDLESYVERYGNFKEMKFPPIKIVTREFSDIRFFHNLIMDSNTNYYIIYNGDNPAVIDFRKLIQKFKTKRRGAILYKLKFEKKASMAYTILVANQKTLMNVINKAIDKKWESPNIFEMIINILQNKGIEIDSFSVKYWPIKNIPDYYYFNIEVIRNPDLFNFLYKKSSIKSKIFVDDIARIGAAAQITNSFISDGCEINGIVKNSIIFPGVVIGEKTKVIDSIILPFSRIGVYSNILRAVVDETTEREAGDLNIGNQCKIGSEHENIKNNDFPRAIYGSITLIGKDCDILDGAIIGGACYVSSGLGREYFAKTRHLYDGLSLIK